MKTHVFTSYLLLLLILSCSGCFSRSQKSAPDASLSEKEVALTEEKKEDDANKDLDDKSGQDIDTAACRELVTKTKYQKINPKKVCSVLKQKPICNSVKNQPIYHFEKSAKDPRKGNRILVVSLIHGDEVPSGLVSYSWIQRLVDLESRNSWRVIPMANPDGFFKRTRMNANGVDINRNFPTKDWEEKALERWKTVKKKDPRKFPGNAANSQPETQCLVQHIEDFKPNFIISIHTPLGVLDFDGPKNLRLPNFKPLPWISLGNYPGSLGRYMWKEQNIPVLTIELNNELAVYNLEKFDKLQDISGTVAIQAIKKSKDKKVVK